MRIIANLTQITVNNYFPFQPLCAGFAPAQKDFTKIYGSFTVIYVPRSVKTIANRMVSNSMLLPDKKKNEMKRRRAAIRNVKTGGCPYGAASHLFILASYQRIAMTVGI